MTQCNHLLERFSAGFDLLSKDVTFVFDQKRRLRRKRVQNLSRPEVKANKFLLSLASPVFDAMFNGPLKEQKNRIYIRDLKNSAFEMMLE